MDGQPPSSVLPISIRVFTDRVPDEEPGETRRNTPLRRRLPHEALVFDTETYPGPTQPLMVLPWRLYRDRWDRESGSTCIEEGLAYPDHLPTADPEGFATLCEFVEGARSTARVIPGFRGLRLEPLSWWLQARLFVYGYKHRDRCDVVAFNALFDLGRVAKHWAPARGRYRGGWSLAFWGSRDEEGRWHDLRHHPRLLAKSIDPLRTLYSWGALSTSDVDKAGATARIVDLHTLAFTLSDRNLTLEMACDLFGDPYEKLNVEYGEISSKLLSYALEDVRHTGTLYCNVLRELARHGGVRLEPHRLYSPATVGSRYLEAMGLARPLEKFGGWGQRSPSHRSSILGWSCGGFFGGRAEARIVRTPVPVVYVDVNSTYPLVNSLLGTWDLLRARELRHDDVTDKVRRIVGAPDLVQKCLKRRFWKAEIGVTLVEVEPDGAILPVRAPYAPYASDPGIGVNPLRYDGRLWYMLPDVIAVSLLGNSPRIVRAIRVRPVGVQPGLRPVRLRGGREIDPRTADPFVAMVEERRRLEQQDDPDSKEARRQRDFLKVTANSTAYGSLARFDRRNLAAPVPVTVYGPAEPFTWETDAPEDPGPYCEPPVAASITAGARLLLAMLERLVSDAGGAYAAMDTDSIMIVASPDDGIVRCTTERGNEIHALSFGTVQSLIDLFGQLNPFDPALVNAAWKVEHTSLAQTLWVYAISAKCYCLYRLGETGQPVLVDWSEHGLGLYLDPLNPERQRRDEQGRRIWIKEAWEWILRDALAPDASMPTWGDRFALTRFTISGPHVAGWFAGFDRHRPPSDRIRPGSFGLLAHTNYGLLPPTWTRPPLPAAIFESDSTRWPKLAWFDGASGARVRIVAANPLGDPERFADAIASGDVPVKTLRDVLHRFRERPEHKSLGPDRLPAGPRTTGLLLRRGIESSPGLTELRGKEGHGLAERNLGLLLNPAEYGNAYGLRAGDPFRDLVAPVLLEIGVLEVAKRTRLSRWTVQRTIRGKDTTDARQATKRVLTGCASDHAARSLRARGLRPPKDPLARLVLHVRELDNKRCALDGCETSLQGRQLRYCSRRHKQAAWRRRGH